MKYICSFCTLTSIAVIFLMNANANSAETIKQLRASRDAFINDFRIHGTRDPEKARVIEENILAFLEAAHGEERVRALFELATMQRMTNRFREAINTYERAAEAAETLNHKELMFDAWLGVARSHIYGTRDHGAAAKAFELAIRKAGSEPTPKQRYEMAGYESQIQAGRGELAPALVNAIEANHLAQDDSDLFYAQLDAGDVLQKFAESCDYQKLVDAKTYASEDDPWGACRRAVDAAKTFYTAARHTAQKLAWDYLVKESDGFIRRLDIRLLLINQKASFEQLGSSGAFQAQDVADVLVNEDFSAGASALDEGLPLGALIDEVAPESQAADPRSIYLRGIKADLDGNPQEALGYFQRAADLLATERSSLLDLRRRGTVIENRPELVRDLALRFLSFGQLEDAFVAFESIRSQGLAALAAAYDGKNFKETERKWLADLVQLESQASAIQTSLVETTIAGVEHSRSVELVMNLDAIAHRRRELLGQVEFQPMLKALTSVKISGPTLAQFQSVVNKTGISVLFYWVTHTNVIVWAISPGDAEVKTVFLPEVAVIVKVGKLVESVSATNKPFDETTARELHTYLIKPFEKHLNQEQVLIIPQGPLVNLPFEVLVNTESGNFLAEEIAISYAPSATFAKQSLDGPVPVISKLTAVYDKSIEQDTREISRIGDIDGLQTTSLPSQSLTSEGMIKLLGQAENVHILLHGEYNYEDPLQSKISLTSSVNSEEITAAELLAVDWAETRLAVLSSCEGAAVKTRISNELFGISWALLAGGVDHVVLSRWRVQAASNADWMETFYQHLVSERTSPALAAAAAMRKMINSNRRDPYFWAGQQVFGR